MYAYNKYKQKSTKLDFFRQRGENCPIIPNYYATVFDEILIGEYSTR